MHQITYNLTYLRLAPGDNDNDKHKDDSDGRLKRIKSQLEENDDEEQDELLSNNTKTDNGSR